MAYRQTGYEFRRQITISGYIADFYSADARVIIEVDGKSHSTKSAREYDEHRDKALARHQILTLRFTNEEILENPKLVYEKIVAGIEKRRKTPTNILFPDAY